MCAFYHWTIDYVLDMPIRRFLAFLKESRRAHIWSLCELSDIVAGSGCTAEYFTHLKGFYFDKLRALEDAPIVETIQQTSECLSGEQASNALIRLFAAKKASE